jgi:hypothetical protein
VTRPLPSWTIPLTGSAPATLTIDSGFATPAVLLTIPPGQIGGEARVLTALECCQVGMAMVEASKVVGQLAARKAKR